MSTKRRVMRPLSVLPLLLLPLACAAPGPDLRGQADPTQRSAPEPRPSGPPTVRHAGSTVPYGDDARWHLFVFDPAVPRPLRERLALARASLRDDPDCRWVRAARSEIEEQTARQGARYAATTVAVPLRCDA